LYQALLSLLVVVFLFFTTGCQGHQPAFPQEQEKAIPVIKPSEVSITVVAVGDFLMHMPVVCSVRNPETGRFEFSEIFSPVKHLFTEADYSIANLETTLAGSERGYSGYPRFNCPADLAAEMRECGLDMFLTANNHSLDKGATGAIATIENLEAAGMDHIGTYRSQEEKDRPFIKNLWGIQVGIMNYTESTNGLPIPRDKPYLVNVINRQAMLQEITALQDAGADIIIACLHFGIEYSRQPSERQKELVCFLFGSGVDIVLGSHPHVVQPTEIRTVIEYGVPKKKFVAYSLGNFISNQRWQYADSGLLVGLTIKKQLDSGVTILDEVTLVPIWVHKYLADGRMHYRVLPVHQALADYRNNTNPLLSAGDYQRLKQVADELSPCFLLPPASSPMLE
jgi:poly-gamma-glutamate synthesis protein (capsule biosynthesis protein)